jgi:uncharacterized protein YfdQ (DUF2303 family)
MMSDNLYFGIQDTISIDDFVDYIMQLNTHEEIFQFIQKIEQQNIVITEGQGHPRAY